jgi:hypothetical protein
MWVDRTGARIAGEFYFRSGMKGAVRRNVDVGVSEGADWK